MLVVFDSFPIGVGAQHPKVIKNNRFDHGDYSSKVCSITRLERQCDQACGIPPEVALAAD